MSHTINLSSHWTVSELEPGRVLYARRFGRPRTLSPGETAWLVGDRSPGSGSVSINGEPAGAVSAGSPFAFDVTGLLRIRNEVWIDVRAAGGEPLGIVAMEIRSAG